MYERLPADEGPDAFGLTRADFERVPVEVWPENFTVFRLFCDLQTQWRTGMGGPTGLDYNTLFHRLDRMRLSDEDYTAIEDDIRVMEYEALATMHDQAQ
jgi:hypothetical protein